MIIETYTASLDERYLTASGLLPDECIYFDIETTGLKAETSHLYLIGYAVKNAGGWKIVQLFAEKTSEEEAVLRQFSDICGRYKAVIHFNGDRFDIPYLEKKYAEYELDSPLRNLATVDIYRRIRPFKSLLHLDRLNQKTLERFLKINRKDQYDGGQLIGIYRLYRDHLSGNPAEDLGHLLLHNYEDVLGMFSLTKLLAYPLAIEAGEKESLVPVVRLVKGHLSLLGEMRPDQLVMSYDLPVPVPVPVSGQGENIGVSLAEDTCEIAVSLKEGELFHFFEDYKNYYYLPEEDRAVHKSVARFVDKDHRVKARADNCYVRKRGRFLPVPAGVMPDEHTYPLFHEVRKEKTGWVECTDELLRQMCSGDLPKAYLRMLLGGSERGFFIMKEVGK